MSACAFSPDKLLSPLATSVRCAGPVSQTTKTVLGIEVPYWVCEAHRDEDARDSAEVYGTWRVEDIKRLDD